MTSEMFKADFPTETIKEGKAKLLVPKLKAFKKSPSDYAPSKAPVFYNPVMKLNRDLAVLALQAYQKMLNREISACEPLAGCGIRGIRFALEVEGVRNVLMGDINKRAFELAKHNVQINELSECVTVRNEDANLLLSGNAAPRKRFDYIDIDPFGSPVPYLESAIRALRNGGLLALTATDMAPLCGVHPRACIRRYGGKPLRTEYCHEIAVRLMAGCLVTTAAKYDIGVDILFSYTSDHYARIYAKISYGAKKADVSLKEMGYILHCFSCFHREATKHLFSIESLWRCSECNSKLDSAGPLWLGKIFDGEFCECMKELCKKRVSDVRMRRILDLAKEEAEAPITYYVVDRLSGSLALPVPPVRRVVEVLRNSGFQACLTLFCATGIRSDVSAAKMRQILQKIMAV